ncbi:Retrovirus-related Pol polyprotein from transposon TNT 1-94 [Gossypium australe]|uniref:Retrovirus-related Pol polyprotein from transposon TNT 1-94 n=1 Tax=Gossypium australe TaxID=47621 RepID=A0A5B6WS34_9ROSI|nr:Retrovirus-related Pol polyprotein from transposon TNT 1-94 [Gossypium australe]
MVFSCVCFVHLRHGSKLDPRIVKCVFIGYSPTQKGYKCYHPPFRKYYVSMNVTFCEDEPYFSSSQPSLQGEVIENEEMTPCSVTLPRENLVSAETSIQEKTSEQLLDRPNLSTYTRKGKKEDVIIQSTLCPDSSLSGESSLLEFATDLELPIAQRKGVRTCTLHPISNFVSYDSLSSFYRDFTVFILYVCFTGLERNYH